MKTALVIMAAGIGSRFGGGIKQLAAVGPNGEIIMDYSIHDAIEAGFDKIVFIIVSVRHRAFWQIAGENISTAMPWMWMCWQKKASSGSPNGASIQKRAKISSPMALSLSSMRGSA